jgi:hypothetical protein
MITYLSPEQLSERWGGISLHTLHHWRWKRVGPRHVVIGRRVRYPLAEVEAYEERSRWAASGEADRRGKARGKSRNSALR